MTDIDMPLPKRVEFTVDAVCARCGHRWTVTTVVDEYGIETSRTDPPPAVRCPHCTEE